jgi:hypothetical protein
MKTYVAVIGGEAIIAFRAENEILAVMEVEDKKGGWYRGILRADGAVLWDEESEIGVRAASAEEHERWLAVCDSAIGPATEGKLMDPEMHDDVDDICAYLIPVRADEGDEEAA